LRLELEGEIGHRIERPIDIGLNVLLDVSKRADKVIENRRKYVI
jgi:hypothetical protein